MESTLLQNILPQAVGGGIAGVIGLITARKGVEYRNEIEISNWETQLTHLTERLQFGLGNAEHETSNVEKQRTAIRTAELVIPELEQHLAQAPVKIPEEVREKQDNLIGAYARLEKDKIGEIATVNRLKKISRRSDQIRTTLID